MMKHMLILVGIVLLAAVACSGDARTAEVSTLAPSPPPTPAPTPTPKAGLFADKIVLTPTPRAPRGIQGTPTVHGLVRDRSHEGKATASIEERVYLSDVVVRARLQSAGYNVLTFNAVSYLKGTGPTRFTVRASTENRVSQWDNQDAMLFLVRLEGQTEDFKFTDTTTGIHLAEGDYSASYKGSLPEGYTLGTRNPVWLPVEQSGSASQRSVGASGGTVLDHSVLGVPVKVSQTDLIETIRWVQGSESNRDSATSQSANARNAPTSEHYDICVVAGLYFIRIIRDREAAGKPYEIPVWNHALNSGDGRGEAIVKFEYDRFARSLVFNSEYHSFWIFGPDADLFKSRIVDDNDSPSDGYVHDVINKRPLPAGVYTFHHYTQLRAHVPCDFTIEGAHQTFVVTVTPPEGTIHEALFDPATTTSGVGYLATTSTSTGVLEPAGFSVRGRAITITGLTWQNGRVVLTLDRFGSWLDGFSFIEPDGTVGLRLAEVDATKDWTARTLTWEVSEQPWESGDELMMRMGPIPLPAVRNLTAEANSAGEAVLRWEVAYRAGVSGYRIWRHRPGRDEGPRIYVSDTLSTDTTYTDANSPVPNLTEYSVQAIDRIYNAGESSESVRVGSQ